jgi:hypothetical protein
MVYVLLVIAGGLSTRVVLATGSVGPDLLDTFRRQLESK